MGDEVSKLFFVEDSLHLFNGVINSIDMVDGLTRYLIVYEDGDTEHVEESEACALIAHAAKGKKTSVPTITNNKQRAKIRE